MLLQDILEVRKDLHQLIPFPNLDLGSGPWLDKAW